jgi:DNA-binding NtrC family response regulator
VARILVLEDDRDALELLECLLELLGHEVTGVSNGNEGLEAKPETFDAIILDLRMPVIDGRAFKRELDERAVKVPVIIMSAEACVDSVAIAMGAFDYLRKPAELSSVSAVVSRALAATGPSPMGPTDGSAS